MFFMIDLLYYDINYMLYKRFLEDKFILKVVSNIKLFGGLFSY